MNRRNVTLPVDDVGALLTETARAFLHGGTPCALLSRLIAACHAFESETAVIDDRDFVRHFRAELETMRPRWRDNADRAYAPDANRYYTLLVPYTEENRTEWHPRERTGPFSVLNRGAFPTVEAAHEWAKAHIPGTAYEIRSNIGDDIGDLGGPHTPYLAAVHAEKNDEE